MIDLSIVYPAYNEEDNLPTLLNSTMQVLQDSDINFELIVVNDGSSDKTQNILNRFKETYPKIIRIIEHEHNLGYGQSLKDGFLAANGQYVFYTDSDLQFDLNEIKKFYALKHEKTLIIGYRLDRQDAPLRIFMAKGYRFLINLLFSLGVKDIDCAFKLFPKNLFQNISIESKKFLIDAEILIKAKKQGYAIHELGVKHFARQHGQSTVKWFHILLTLKEMFKLKLTL